MFYEPAKKNHGLSVDPFKAVVVPRPIGWITTVDVQGRVNLAPFSFYNGVSDMPPMVMFCPGGSYGSTRAKHSLLNAKATGEFALGRKLRPQPDGTAVLGGLFNCWRPRHASGRRRPRLRFA